MTSIWYPSLLLAPKNLGISKVTGLSCSTNKVNFWKAPKNGGWLPWEPTVTGNSESHLLISGKGERMQTQSITNGQWLNQSCLCKEASIKPKRDRFQRASRWVNVEIWGEWRARRGHRSSMPFSPTLYYTSLPSDCS